MSSLTRWLTKSDLSRIENIEDFPKGTLQPDEGPEGRLEGGYAANVINRFKDPDERSRVEYAIERFCEER